MFSKILKYFNLNKEFKPVCCLDCEFKGEMDFNDRVCNFYTKKEMNYGNGKETTSFHYCCAHNKNGHCRSFKMKTGRDNEKLEESIRMYKEAIRRLIEVK